MAKENLSEGVLSSISVTEEEKSLLLEYLRKTKSSNHLS